MQSDVVVLIALIFGVGIGLFLRAGIDEIRRKRKPSAPQEEAVKVKRTRPSLRNPMRTYDTKYDDFKTKRGLYEPVRPKGAPRPQDDELEV